MIMINGPEPTPEEAAVIMAAAEALWPRPVIMQAASQQPRHGSWRFSGRWWSVPIPMRRDRPWI